ncbi:MAG: ribbon-helix-helix protein, CopG family [Candidatus Bathyarchaeota archaeon]|nr:ribbon-helix-helix protein, CopG family [Candidatus Bathyarchaeota archaeon]
MPRNPTRITVAFDSATASLLEKITKETELSQSEIMRRALKFYSDNQALTDPATRKKAYAYMELLLDGEHIILDVDHWLLFLRLIESTPEKEKFWNEHREVARAHKDQLKTKVLSAEELLTRLETCNFYRLTKNSERDYTLIFGSELPKKFVRVFLEEFFSAMAIKAEIKENFTKLNVTVKPTPR